MKKLKKLLGTRDLEECRSALSDSRERIAVLESQIVLPFELGEPQIKDSAWVNSVLAQIPNWQNGVFRWPMDSRYYLCSQEEMRKFIQWDWVSSRQYIAEIFDCENFAFWFKGRADGLLHRNNVGFIVDWSGGHAYNVIVFPDNELWIFEPQNDSWTSITDHSFSSSYPLESAGILI